MQLLKLAFTWLQLIHEIITEDIPCSRCTQNQSTSEHSGSLPENTDPILHRLTNLVQLVKQSKAGNFEGKVHSSYYLAEIHLWNVMIWHGISSSSSSINLFAI